MFFGSDSKLESVIRNMYIIMTSLVRDLVNYLLKSQHRTEKLGTHSAHWYVKVMQNIYSCCISIGIVLL